MAKLIRRWPIGTILHWGDHDYRILGYRNRGAVVKLGRLSRLESPAIEWRFRRSVEYIEKMVALYARP